MTAFVVLTILGAIALVVWALLRPHSNALDLELQRIEQAKQAAIEDIRRRRQFAEEQLRRLGRWTR